MEYAFTLSWKRSAGTVAEHGLDADAPAEPKSPAEHFARPDEGNERLPNSRARATFYRTI